MATTFNLIVSLQGEDPIQYVLKADRIGIGRGPENQIRLDHTSISAGHIELRKTSFGGYEMEDIGSSNGVHVNGRKVRRAVLTDGDRLLIGGTVIAYFLVLPEGAEVEDFVTQTGTGREAETRKFLDLAERLYEMKRTLRKHQRHAESLEKEIDALEVERHRRQEKCNSLASAVGEKVDEIRSHRESDDPTIERHHQPDTDPVLAHPGAGAKDQE